MIDQVNHATGYAVVPLALWTATVAYSIVSGRDAALTALKAAVGEGNWTDDPAELAPHLVDWRGRVRGRAALLVLPRDTVQVAALVATAAKYGIPLVPQGGNTGLVGGGIPDTGGSAVVVAMTRMSAVEDIDLAGSTMIVGAGAILQKVQEAAKAVDRVFPLSLAAKGSATIGGLVSTNAGGVQVLRHGNMRALVVGLEAVLPDGSVLRQLNPLIKDNSGYDIKQLLIGAEGTLGIVTRVALRLSPAPRDTAVAWIGLKSPEAALALLGLLRERFGEIIESFELVPRAGLDLVVASGLRAPLAEAHAWNVLVEVNSVRADARLADALLAALEDADVEDAVIAQTNAQAEALWALREMLPEAERRDGLAVKHDVSVPVASMPTFLACATPQVERDWPGARVLAFGHLGDGNVHFNVRAPEGVDAAGWVDANGTAITMRVNDIVVATRGSIAAEHGIGSVKVSELARLVDPAKLAAIRAIKAAFDPHGIMNPGKVLI
ncbi:MAG: FAD-binding oxidoreductase [Janthinobacterium lividum]